MSSLKDQCQKFFGTTDLYEILEIETTASEKEIKKAYHKLSLRVHPDRVPENEKQLATEKFKVLGRIHSVLQDNEKRKVYDDCDQVQEDDDNITFNWIKYWNVIFKKIDLEDIQNHEKEYIGSDTELLDIKNAYTGTKGKINLMLDMIPFSNCDSLPRIQNVVRGMINNGEVEEFPGFFNESKQTKRKRREKWKKSKKKAERIQHTWHDHVQRYENYEKEYIGSETESQDIMDAYIGTKGNLSLMLDMIPFSDGDSVPRIQEVVRNMIDAGKVEEYSAFFKKTKLKGTPKQKQITM